MRSFPVFLLVLVLSAAGCVAEEPDPVAAACEADCPECPPEADCLITCRDCGPCGEGEPTPECPMPAAPVPVTMPFAFEGRTGTAGCLVTPAAVECARVTSPEWAPPEVAGAWPVALHANISSTDPLAEHHEYYASLWVDEGEGWTWDAAREPITTGPAPLSVSWSLEGYPRETKFLLWVEAYRETGPVYAVADHAYAAEGAFVHVVR